MAHVTLSRQKRGEIDHLFILNYKDCSNSVLIDMLSETDPQKRTVAATLLGKKKCHEAIELLCKCLFFEKALYSKIAISEALGNIGEPSLQEMFKYIGKIEKNQHQTLPDKLFKKWSYPLPRDIIIRTIVKIGQPSLAFLRKSVLQAEPSVAAELLDGIGHVSFYSKDQEALDDVIMVLKKHEQNEIVVWKVLRALQAFSNSKSIEILQEYFLNSNLPELRWEAARSLGQLKAEQILMQGLNDPHIKVREMVKLSLGFARNNSTCK
jgi:hypothetical protein